MRIHVVVEKRGDSMHFDFSGSADQTQGPANIRPPLVQAACAYCADLADRSAHVSSSSGLLRAFSITAREGSVLNPRFPAPVNTYNPTVHALVDALFAALGPIVPGKVRADGSGSRSIIIGGRSTSAGKGYVQYEIIGGGGGARATKDGASRHHRQPEQRQASRRSRSSRANFRPACCASSSSAISAAPGLYRGGLGIRREYLNLADARFSIRSMKHVIPPNGAAGGGTGRPGDIWINPGSDQAKRLPTRYADYPLKEGDIFRLDTPGGGGYGDPLVAAGGARARRCARRLCVAGGGRARLRCGADGGSKRRGRGGNGKKAEQSSMDQTNAVKRTGMIGLGAMGLQFARHMQRKGF